MKLRDPNILVKKEQNQVYAPSRLQIFEDVQIACYHLPVKTHHNPAHKIFKIHENGRRGSAHTKRYRKLLTLLIRHKFVEP